MDGDGDLDIVSASWQDDTIAWYENDGAATWTPAFTKANIDSNFFSSPFDVHHGDFDNDGDIDIVLLEYKMHRSRTERGTPGPQSENYTVHIYENDGAVNPSFTKSTIQYQFLQGTRITFADINRDGNLDIVVGSTDGGMRADLSLIHI